MTTDDQDKKITLATLLGRVWPRSHFMIELTRKDPSTLMEFMDRLNEFINAEDTLWVLVGSHQEMKKGERRGKKLDRYELARKKTRKAARSSPKTNT